MQLPSVSTIGKGVLITAVSLVMGPPRMRG
jgi:hypothetical protein